MAEPRRRQGFWLTAGEIVGALALVVAALSYWETHRQHTEETRRVEAQARAQSAFVVTGEAESAGRRIVIAPLKGSQAIQSQRYLFPKDVLDHAMEITAARPQIDVDWIAGGLRRTLDAARAKGAGEATLPVAILTTYVEDGDTRTDRSLYRIGYAWRSRLLGGKEIVLQGLSLSRRAVAGDLQANIETRWAMAKEDLAKQ